ncbi:SpvB/TcaC N-terminal domain-containing protein [Actinoplanes sp. NPDC024001]|uniref:SpvB/TcaC N-terminal domain-containing protein n=1 Tax=Actinoplanes sp. NPDC024001 TaxID=3154598 RepID=UPI003406FED0
MDDTPARQFDPPVVSLPKGGGAIRGIGEKFTANAVTGTGSFGVPLPVSPGRSGFQPEVTLGYDSGFGNGPFGLGWSLGTPAVTRKIDQGVPLYDESDVFVLSGAQDLVPAVRLTPAGEVELDGQGRPVPDVDERDGYRIVRYRPRVEGLFARIERWTRADDVFWRTISRDNVTTVYGRDGNSRVADGYRIFSWLICESYDDKGNAVEYEYQADGTQRYLKAIRYGNVVSRLHPEPPADQAGTWLFEMVFDYGEGHYTELPADPAEHHFVRASPVAVAAWADRPDPFSTFRAGFEVRTSRRCHRVLMFHRIPELGDAPCLVRALEFGYQDLGPTGVTAEQELTHAGSTRFGSFLMSVTQQGFERAEGDRYLRQSLPAVTFRYSVPVISRQVRAVDTANLPAGLGAGYQWADLDGEGVNGVLTEQGGAWWYKRNHGSGQFGALELVAQRPAGLSERWRLLDLAGDGTLDVVELGGAASGFTERTTDGGWAPHRGFGSLPNLRWDDRNLRFADLTGDGRADVLTAADDGFTWHPSLGEEGFGPQQRAVGAPRLVFADSTESVYLADMSGDGLADLVQIANGEISYWPSLGHGRFGARVVMANPPLFDHPEQFAQQRIQLADLDGSGPADIVYAGRDGTHLYFNQCGNRWSDPVTVPGFPQASVSVVDLLGTGTACLVWSSPLPGDGTRFLELMAAGKPHLLVESANGLGAETRLSYAPSTRFSLADAAAGRPWQTRLPFPVHVVERVETVDRISGNRFTSHYEYHDGHFDGVEREFRGFGQVDQYDSERYDLDQDSAYVPPALTRTWFHLGLSTSPDEARLSPEELRALHGSMLRQEVYALDGSDRAEHPYVVTEHTFAVRRVQDGVFLTHPVASVSRHHERDPNAARVTHELTLAVNNFGQVTRAASIGYGSPVLATLTETDHSTMVSAPDDHRMPVPFDVRTYEVTDLVAPAAPALLSAAEVETAPTRLIKQERTRFGKDDLSGPCDWGRIESRLLPFETYRLAFTPELLEQTYGELLTDTAGVLAEGGYTEMDGAWWAPSGQILYGDIGTALRHFFLPSRYRTAFGAETAVTYDTHDMQVAETVDPLGNRVSAELDYRTLSPWLLTDANGNRSAVAFDALGLVVATALLGKAPPHPAEGDQLAGFTANLTPSEVAQDFTSPSDLLGEATTRMVYDLFAYQRSGAPAGVHVMAREQHGADGGVQHSFSYSDGFGREIQKKLPSGNAALPWAGSGWTEFNNKGRPVRQYEPFFSATHRCDLDARIGVARTLFYDPVDRVVAVLHPDHTYEKTVFEAWQQVTYDLNDTVTSDPRTDPHLAGIVDRYFAEQGPQWQTWLERRAGSDEAIKAATHAGTPTTVVFDAFGRTVLTRVDNGAERFESPVVLDVEGNPRAVIDALGRTVVEYDYDLAGHRVHESSVDSGERWTLPDVGGNPMRVWDSRGHAFRTAYDELRRPVERFVDGGSYHRVEYGEGQTGDDLRGRMFREHDDAGVLTYRYDFKGNVTGQVRELDGALYETVTRYDALNRPVQTVSPGSDVTRPSYDAAGRLAKLDVWIAPGDPEVDPPSAAGVDEIEYDAKGQRTPILYRNGVTTTYEYDPETFRLLRLSTGSGLQDVHYAYDPVGNVTRIRDEAQKRVFFRNQVVDASTDYTYDPLYRLVQALGREHVGQAGVGVPYTWDSPHPADGEAMGRYCETYEYDAAGNLLAIRHRQSCPGAINWSRTFTYADDSGNRLMGSAAGGLSEQFGYDAHGNLLGMAHVPEMTWDSRDRLSATRAGTERTRHVYDAAGQRIRKINATDERIYLGGVELYRNASGLVRRTVHVMDGKQRIALVEIRNDVDDGTPQQVIRYQLGNHLGSVGLELDETARIISYEEYSPYGSTTFQNVSAEVKAAAKRYRYTGKERDRETGLDYAGARYLAPWLGRWISPDPAGIEDGLNVYCYVQSNPVNLVDESGRYAKGGSTTSIQHFVQAVRTWQPEAMKHRRVVASKAGVRYETTGHEMIRIFDNDFRELNTADQIVSQVGGKKFSYYGHFLRKGKEKTQQKYIDAGLPLDVEHFFRVAALAQDYPDWLVRRAYFHEEFNQAQDTRPAGRTSAFAPEDLFSNEVGLIFGTTVGEAADAPGFDFATELDTYLKEVRTLFTTDALSDGKYLTADRIQDLRDLAQTYYGTEDLRTFLKTGKIFQLSEIKKINDNAAVENYPFYNNPVSAEEFTKQRQNQEQLNEVGIEPWRTPPI